MTEAGFAPSPGVVVRDTEDTDFQAIQAIYAQEVRHGLASFEEVPPTVDEMKTRRADILALGLPYLTAALGGGVVGYAHAGPYRLRPAYRYTVETSVYVAQDRRGCGIGQALLAGLIARAEIGPWRQLVAVIGDSGNARSIALHNRLGFRQVGTLDAVGHKLDRWVDTVLMQRPLGPGGTAPPDLDGWPDQGR